jgi:hypothetical protein
MSGNDGIAGMSDSKICDVLFNQYTTLAQNGREPIDSNLFNISDDLIAYLQSPLSIAN